VSTQLTPRLAWQIRLKALMGDEALSQADLAPVFGVSRAAVSHYLSGRTEPSIEQISAVAKYIGVSLDYLIHGETIERSDVPLLMWDMIESYLAVDAACAVPENVPYIRCAVRSCSSRSFAVKVQGDSMDASGGYRHGDVIYVDPDKPPAHGHDVIVKLAEQRLVLRRLSVHEDGTRYFRALNMNVPMNFEGPVELARIYGVVIFSGCFRV
jgi:SOS-response transcriptional repressor LexA